MPLNVAALQSGLESVFSNPPGTYAEAAQGWADAAQSWATGITPPSTTVAAAAATLSSQLAAAFEQQDAIASMESAFSAFALTVGGGMAGFVPTPPPAPVGFQQQFSSPHPETHAAAAQAIAGIIDAWMRTGIATMVAPPNTPVPWS